MTVAAYRDEFETAAEFWAAVVEAGVYGPGQWNPKLQIVAAATGSGVSVPSDF